MRGTRKPSRLLVVTTMVGVLLGWGAVRALADPTFTLNPNTGSPGTLVQTAGTGFGASEIVDILFLQNGNTKGLTSTGTDVSGNFNTTITIPLNASNGTATVKAQGETSRLIRRASFLVTGAASHTLTLNPNTGSPGTVVATTGAGYGDTEIVDILFLENGQTKGLTSVTTDASGNFSTNITIPLGATNGASTVKAQGETSRTVVKATFTVTGAAAVTLDPDSGPPLTNVQVTGTAFGASEIVDVLFLQNGQTKALGSAVTDASGNFSVPVTIPMTATVGASTIKCQGETSLIGVKTTFTVT